MMSRVLVVSVSVLIGYFFGGYTRTDTFNPDTYVKRGLEGSASAQVEDVVPKVVESDCEKVGDLKLEGRVVKQDIGCVEVQEKLLTCEVALSEKFEIIERFSKREITYSESDNTNELRSQLAVDLSQAINLRKIVEFHSMQHYKQYLHHYTDQEAALELMKKYFFPDGEDLSQILKIYVDNYSAQQLANIITFYDTSEGASLAEREQVIGYKIRDVFIKKANKNMQQFLDEANVYVKKKDN